MRTLLLSFAILNAACVVLDIYVGNYLLAIFNIVAGAINLAAYLES